MDIRQARYVVEVARQGSFTKAAETLHVAQPAVSMAIRALEQELEVVLFNRQDRRVALTVEGEAFLAHARRLLDEVEAARLEMAELRGLERGEVRVGIPPMMSAYFFPDIIHDFTLRYPGLRLSVFGEGAWRIRTMISAGEIDMGVVASRSVSEDMESRHILREEVVVCTPLGHPLASRESVSFDEFCSTPLLFYKEGYYLREMMSEMAKEGGNRLNVVFESNLFSLVKSLVSRGMGISAFLRMVVSNDSDVSAVPFDPPLYLDLDIAWKRSSYLSRANRAFADFLGERATI